MKQKKEMPEVVIPAGYNLDEVMDFDDDDFGGRTNFDGGGEVAF